MGEAIQTKFPHRAGFYTGPPDLKNILLPLVFAFAGFLEDRKAGLLGVGNG
jgi:hypothetical protein